MHSKYVYQRFCELAIAVPIIFGTVFCMYPFEGMFFKWWEDHTFLIMLTSLGLGLLFFFFDYKRLMIVSFAACASLCLMLEARTQVPMKQPKKTSDAIVKVAQFSLSQIDTYFDEDLHTMLDTKADLISIQQVKLEGLARLNEFFTCCGYPYSECVMDDASQSAIVVYSRYPFSFITDAKEPNVPGILGKFQLPIGKATIELFFFSTFMQPVVDEKSYAKVRKRLQSFAYQLNHIKAPLLVCGDYNMLPWSKDLQSFKTYAHLRDSRRGVMPIVPSGYSSLLNYPFDHIFYSDHFKCIHFEMISSASKLHLGVVGTYQFKKKEPVSNAKKASQSI